MVIEKAKKEYAEQIAQLLQYIFSLHEKGRPDVFAGRPKYDAEDIRRLIDGGKTLIYVALDGNEVTGYLIAALKDVPASPHMRAARTLYIDDLCVKESHKREGIGKALFEQAKRTAKFLDCERIDLNVWSFNDDAIKFYQKMGMTVSRMNMEYKL